MKALACPPSVVALAAVLVVSPSPAAPGQGDEDFQKAVERAGAAALSDDDVEGFAVVVSLGGEVRLERGWGRADGKAVGPGTVLRAGGMSAPWIAHAALRLVERDALAVDAPLAKLLEGFPYEEEGLTLEHLLDQPSGLPSCDELVARRRGDAPLARAELFAWLAERPLEHEPGRCATYSETNVLLLGWIVADAARRPIPDVLRAELFEPLGMESTSYCGAGPPHEHDLVTQEFAGAAELLPGGPQPFGADALCSSALDLARWGRSLLERRSASEASYRRMTASQLLTEGVACPHAAGLNRTALDGHESFTCGGGVAGSRAHVALYPDLDLVVAVLAHGDRAPADRIERAFTRAVLGLDQPGLQDIVLEPDELAVYTGSYLIGCTQVLIGARDGRLIASPSTGESFGLLNQGKHRFVSAADHDVSLAFTVEQGEAVSFVLSEHGVESVATRMGR